MEGYNGTVFAYGQTGTGKTYTMSGDADDFHEKGIMPRAFEDIMQGAHGMTTRGDQGVKVIIQVSYLEIYNEEIRDLLSESPKQRLVLHENKDKGIYVKDLSHHKVEHVDEIYSLLKFGAKNRVTGATNMNQVSSRSHALFQISVEQLNSSP